MDKKILDVCCGTRMFWFDKENKDTVFMDKRELEDTLCDGRKLIIKPPSSNRDYSRELYDGDKITLDGPLDSTFEFKEEKLDNRIDLFDENPFNPFPY